MDILDCLSDHFRWIEEHNLQVGVVFLNPQEITLLKNKHGFEESHGPLVEHDPWPGVLRGTIFGAPVREVLAVPPGHVAILPHGYVLRDIGPAACVSLGLDKPSPG